MKITVENNEMVGTNSINGFLKDLSKVLNNHVVASGSKIFMQISDDEYDDNGMFKTKVIIEFDTKPHKSFSR